MKVLTVTNCQGPVLARRFLKHASRRFDTEFELLPAIQVHVLKPGDEVSDLLHAADVIIAQPVNRNPVKDVLFENLVALNKRLITFPALHFDGLMATSVQAVWKGRNDYPFGQTEDAALAAAYVTGMTAAEAVEAYHEVAVLPVGDVMQKIEQNIGEFVVRENRYDISVPMSDFYAEQWRRQRLHHVKSHPSAGVYAELTIRVANLLGLDDVDLSAIPDKRGNDQFAIPMKKWVMRGLDCTFEDDPHMGMLQNQPAPFEQIVGEIWEMYGSVGAAEVARRHGASPEFDAAMEAYRRVA